ncbi:MAG: hypothetical protein ACKVQC_01710, partial [Elusimicrobiota bacterium]
TRIWDAASGQCLKILSAVSFPAARLKGHNIAQLLFDTADDPNNPLAPSRFITQQPAETPGAINSKINRGIKKIAGLGGVGFFEGVITILSFSVLPVFWSVWKLLALNGHLATAPPAFSLWLVVPFILIYTAIFVYLTFKVFNFFHLRFGVLEIPESKNNTEVARAATKTAMSAFFGLIFALPGVGFLFLSQSSVGLWTGWVLIGLGILVGGTLHGMKNRFKNNPTIISSWVSVVISLVPIFFAVLFSTTYDWRSVLAQESLLENNKSYNSVLLSFAGFLFGFVVLIVTKGFFMKGTSVWKKPSMKDVFSHGYISLVFFGFFISGILHVLNIWANSFVESTEHIVGAFLAIPLSVIYARLNRQTPEDEPLKIFNQLPVLLILIGVPLLDWGMKFLALYVLEGNVLLHVVPAVIGRVIVYQSLAVIIFLLSRKFRVPSALALIIAGGLANSSESYVWQGALDPLFVFGGYPNIADIAIWVGLAILFKDIFLWLLTKKVEFFSKRETRIHFMKNVLAAFSLGMILMAPYVSHWMGMVRPMKDPLSPSKMINLFPSSTIGTFKDGEEKEFEDFKYAVLLGAPNHTALREEIWSRYAKFPEESLRFIEKLKSVFTEKDLDDVKNFSGFLVNQGDIKSEDNDKREMVYLEYLLRLEGLILINNVDRYKNDPHFFNKMTQISRDDFFQYEGPLKELLDNDLGEKYFLQLPEADLRRFSGMKTAQASQRLPGWFVKKIQLASEKAVKEKLAREKILLDKLFNSDPQRLIAALDIFEQLAALSPREYKEINFELARTEWWLKGDIREPLKSVPNSTLEKLIELSKLVKQNKDSDLLFYLLNEKERREKKKDVPGDVNSKVFLENMNAILGNHWQKLSEMKSNGVLLVNFSPEQMDKFLTEFDKELEGRVVPANVSWSDLLNGVWALSLSQGEGIPNNDAFVLVGENSDEEVARIKELRQKLPKDKKILVVAKDSQFYSEKLKDVLPGEAFIHDTDGLFNKENEIELAKLKEIASKYNLIQSHFVALTAGGAALSALENTSDLVELNLLKAELESLGFDWSPLDAWTQGMPAVGSLGVINILRVATAAWRHA